MKRAAIVVWVALVMPAAGQWTEIADGFDYAELVEPGPVEVFVTRLDRSDPENRTIDSAIARGRFEKTGLPNGGRETVSSMALRRDGTLSFHWQQSGRRNEVVAAVNGDYWERTSYPSGSYTGRPASGQVLGGWFCRRFTNWGGGSGFYSTIWGVPHLGGDVVNGTSAARQKVFFADESDAEFDGLNVERGDNDLVLYTPQWAGRTYTDGTGVEVLVQVSRPTLPLPHGTTAYSCSGTVREVNDGVGSTWIPFDHVVLSGTGGAATTLRSRCAVGDTVQLRLMIRDYGLTGRTPPLSPQDWTKAFGAVGVDREIVVAGQVSDNLPAPDLQRDPRTAVGFNDDYAFLVVVDGRRGDSVGMTFGELGAFFVDRLAATHAASLDGGGSSAMWVRGRGIVNRPSDGVERATCNGLLMMRLLPRETSDRFTPGDEARATATVPLRLGPGTGYAVRATASAGETGRIAAHDLAGVTARDTTWWPWTVGDVTGWTDDASLAPPSLPDAVSLR